MCILNMSVVKNSLSLNNLINWTLCFLPISFILGSLLININIMLVVLIGFLSIRAEKLKSNFDKIDAILLIFFIYYIFVTALNINLVGEKILIKAFLLIRFLGLYLVLKVLIENNKINLNNFFKVCLICTSFVSIDLLIQFFYGKDIFGITPHEGRLTGVFGYEAIAGGYVQKLFLFSFLGLFYFLNNKDNKNIFFLIFVMLHLNAVFVASNRMNLILLVVTLILLSILFSKLRKVLILSLFVSYFSFSYLMSTSDQLKNHIRNIEKLSIDIEKIGKDKNISFFNHAHFKLYKAVIESYQRNIYFGNGLKSFRFNCVNVSNCSTHPHNYHLEVLHDTGIIGFTLLTLFILIKSINRIKTILRVNRFNYNLKYFFAFPFINLLIELFPLKSTGSLFGTWQGSLTWLILALALYNMKKIKNSDISKK